MKRGEIKKGTQAHADLRWRGEHRHRPWRDRLLQVLAWVGNSGKRHNVRSHRVTQYQKDERRAVREGYLVVTRPRRFGTIKMVELTELGRSMLAGEPPAPPPQPYAKRAAGMAEFYAANSAAPALEGRSDG